MLPEGKCRYIDGQIYPDGNFYVLDTQYIKHNGSELKTSLNGISTDIDGKPNVYLQSTQPSNLKSGDIWFQIIE